MPKGKKASKEECKQAIQSLKQMKDQKQVQKMLGQLIQAGCITEQQAQKMLGGGGGQASGNPTDMDTGTYEQSHRGTRA